VHEILKRLDIVILLLAAVVIAALAAIVLTQTGHLQFDSSLVRQWYFHLPNFILAALMYTLLGRAVLGLIFQPEAGNYIWRFFCRFTDPVVAAVALVTPKATAPVVIWLFGVVWLFWLRVALLYAYLFLGFAPRLT
jgi:YggT family protein